MTPHGRVLRAIARERWAILPSKLDEIVAVAQIWAGGADVSAYKTKDPADSPQMEILGAAKTGSDAKGAIAVLPVFGTIARRSNLIMEFSGGTSIQKFQNQFRQAMNDPEIGAILLQMDSPGGGVFGVEEMAAEIRQARSRKPIVAFADPVAASAAYWLGSAASEFVVTPSGEVGSIGVYALHEDVSAMNEKLGVKPTYISAGKYKVEGNADLPLTEEAQAHIQQDVDRYYGMFTSAVAKGRGVKREAVLNGFGEGRMLGAGAAEAEGMVDWVGTFDDVLKAIIDGKIGQRRADRRAAVAGIEESLYWRGQQYEGE